MHNKSQLLYLPLKETKLHTVALSKFYLDKKKKVEFILETATTTFKAFHSSERTTGRASTCLGTHYEYTAHTRS